MTDVVTDRFSLTGRVALVTGSSRGLGWAIAKGLAEHGAVVVLNGRERATVEARAAELGGEADVAAFDAADPAACERAVAGIVERRGRLDILVNNAGITHRQSTAEFPTEQWRRVMDVNLTAPFVLSREAVKDMLTRRWGRIVNIASVLSLVARPTIPPYVASKHGLIGLTRALAVEFGPQGITANAIAPGYFLTEFNTPLKANPEFDRMVTTRTPTGRWGDPDELVGAAVFLASDAAAYVNGATLTVDGGMTAALY